MFPTPTAQQIATLLVLVVAVIAAGVLLAQFVAWIVGLVL